MRNLDFEKKIYQEQRNEQEHKQVFKTCGDEESERDGKLGELEEAAKHRASSSSDSCKTANSHLSELLLIFIFIFIFIFTADTSVRRPSSPRRHFLCFRGLSLFISLSPSCFFSPALPLPPLPLPLRVFPFSLRFPLSAVPLGTRPTDCADPKR